MVDLFCGCGGFSLGAELAGFRSLAAIDIDGTLQSSYRRNFPGSAAIEASVADIDASDWRLLLGSARPDGLIGGPPCQGFSWIGKRQKDDPRNSLLHHFYRHVKALRPKFFVMENVEGLLHEDKVNLLTDAIEQIAGRYKVLDPFVVNAADFGAATNRKRVVIIGYDPGEVDELSIESLRSRRKSPTATVRDAISDLPCPIPENRSEQFGLAKYPKRNVEHLSDYAKRLRKRPPARLGWSDAVAWHGNGYVSGLIETRHRSDISRRYSVIGPGETDRITKSYRLDWDGLCPTLRAGTGADKGAFQAVRPLHPGKGRVITVREAARLQGFPDWFVFHETKWHSFRMIGNSVSPAVSYGLMRRIASKVGVPLET